VSASPIDRVDESAESLVGRVADEFLGRRERGEDPSVEEYAARYPHAAELIRRTLAALNLAGGSLGGSTAADESVPEAIGDFRIVREVGRGGMGIVYEAEQLSLHRRVALKVLPFAAVMDPRHLQRFRSEALAAAALDHPHVVKVYGVGQDRGVHYIAMQFVDGRPLSDLIRERRGEAAAAGTNTVVSAQPTKPLATSRTPGDGAYFRRVAGWGVAAADALEHAHAMGVVHRDIKPSNLLVDARGEVHVADFGLAKVSTDPGLTLTGDLVGTARYMSPEQASAKHDLVDHRSDVYSLGVKLYELLTLAPAFDGADRHAVLTQVTGSDPVAPRKRDRAIPRDLETVVLKAMDKDPSRRYQTAGEFGDDLRRFLAAEPVRAKPVTTRSRVARWLHRRPRQVAALIATLVVGIGTLAYWDRERGRAELAATAAVEQAAILWHRNRLSEAEAEARRAVALLPTFGGDRALRRRTTELVTDITFLRRIDEARLKRVNILVAPPNSTPVGEWKAECSAAFRDGFGVDVLADEEAAVVATLGRREIRADLASVLDDWSGASTGEEAQKLTRMAAALDTDPGGMAARWRGMHWPLTKSEVRRLVAEAEADPPPTALLVRFAAALVEAEDPDDGLRFLRVAHRRRPEDVWLLNSLAVQSFQAGPAHMAEAVRFYTAAHVLRPESPTLLNSLGYSLTQLGKNAEGLDYLRKSEAISPDVSLTHLYLGVALLGLGRSNEAGGELVRATALDPKNAEAHFQLGRALENQGRYGEAADAFRASIRLYPWHSSYLNLGLTLEKQGKLAEAVEQYREAIRLRPYYQAAFHNLGFNLDKLHDLDGAFEALTVALCLDPNNASTLNIYGNVLAQMGDVPGAIRSYRAAIAADPRHPDSHYSLGLMLGRSGHFVEAEAEYREAIRLSPDFAEAHCNLGTMLRQQGRFREALAEYKRGHELGQARKEGWPHPSAQWIREVEGMMRVEARLPVVAAGEPPPDDPTDTLLLAKLAMQRKWYATTSRIYEHLFRIDKPHSNAVNGERYNAACAAVLAGCGSGEDPHSLSDADRLRLRRTGLKWLTDELAGLNAVAGQSRGPAAALGLIQHWRADGDLAGIRDEGEFKKLPATEQADWRKLWADVAALQAKLEGLTRGSLAGSTADMPPREIGPWPRRIGR
jgi:serine/threonine protein kinase/Flp pilus assembly protein TadD